MPKSFNQKLKLIYIAQMLQEETDEEHSLSMAQIINGLENLGIRAERKSVYSDIETLRNAGYDIVMRKGSEGGYALVSRAFELAELKLLVDAVQASRFITHRKSLELIKKVGSLASRHQANQLSRQVYVTNRIKTMNESIYYNVDKIHTAISGDKMITFNYFEWNTEKKKVLRHGGRIYRVSPWALIWDDENYYLVAFDSQAQDVRHYRVDKMLKINIIEQKREGDRILGSLDTGLYSKKIFGMYGGTEELVTLRCDDSLAGVVIDRFGEGVVITPSQEGHFEITVKAAVSPILFGWLSNFGAQIKIISPPSVVQGMKEHIASISQLYAKEP